jgi:hypothetical protein
LSQGEWFWVAVIIAIPVILFGTAEMVMLMQRRRYQAIARRREAPRRRPDRRG